MGLISDHFALQALASSACIVVPCSCAGSCIPDSIVVPRLREWRSCRVVWPEFANLWVCVLAFCAGKLTLMASMLDLHSSDGTNSRESLVDNSAPLSFIRPRLVCTQKLALSDKPRNSKPDTRHPQTPARLPLSCSVSERRLRMVQGETTQTPFGQTVCTCLPCRGG
jgi:hypothetical protein